MAFGCLLSKRVTIKWLPYELETASLSIVSFEGNYFSDGAYCQAPMTALGYQVDAIYGEDEISYRLVECTEGVGCPVLSPVDCHKRKPRSGPVYQMRITKNGDDWMPITSVAWWEIEEFTVEPGGEFTYALAEDEKTVVVEKPILFSWVAVYTGSDPNGNSTEWDCH